MRITAHELQACRLAKKEIRDLEERMEESSARLERTTRVISGLPRSSVERPMEAAHAALMDDMAHWAARLQEMLTLIRRAEAAFAQLPDQQRRLMTMRYIDAYSWARIAMRMTYDQRWCTRMHARALIALGVRDEQHAPKSP